MYSSSVPASIPPRAFKAVIGRAGPQFSGYQQQDSQEFVGFLLDGLSEDLNRIQKKPYTEKPDSTDEMVDDPAALNEMADKCWDMYRARNDSPIVDLFAGSYKSTLVCPICNKVSITFDPFTNLTLQLPVPNLWSYRVKYFPLYDPPILVEVDIPKSGSIFDLKTFLASRVKTDARRLFGAELWKGKIFKTYADNRSVTEDIHIDTNDQPVFWELQDIPSANLGPTKKKSMLLVDDDDSIAKPVDTDNIVVPVYMRHQTTRLGRTPYRQFGEPFYILITEADANDLNLLRRKLLAKVSTFTTTRLAGMDTDDAADVYSDAKENASSSSTDGSGVMVDAMETTDEVTESHDNGTIENDEIEFVDVPATDRQAERQMTEFLERINDKPTNASAQLHPTIRPILDLERPLPPRIEQLFVIKCFSPRSEPISTGWNQINDSDDFTDVTTRIPRPEETTEGSEASDDVSAREDSDDSTDELRSTMVQPTHSFTTKNLDDEGSQDTDLPSLNELVAPKADRRTKYHVNRIHDSKKSRLINQRGLTSRLRSLGRKRAPEPDPGPLVRMGECLVLDWYEDTHDQHFGSGPTDDGRGSLITDDAYCSVFPDAELDQQRRSRKVRAKNGISLDDCLDAFGKEETLAAGDEWYCPRCKEHRRATKKFELWRTPDILIIHLKRFSSTSRRDKLDIMVEFPTEELDLTSRVSKQLKGRSEMYDLFGVDNHYGGLGGGHYTAYARNWVDGQWNDYNGKYFFHLSSIHAITDYSIDSVVTRTEARHVVTSSAYLLFYRRRSAVPLGGPLFQAICEKEFMDVETDASRNQSPSGDGHPLGGSRNGLPSGLHVEDRAQEVTGKEVILHGGIYGGVNDPPTPPSPELGPPNYGDGGLAEGERTLEPLELDPQSAYSGNTWSWTQGRGLGRASSQMAAMPPDGDDDVDVDVDVDEDLMDPDDSSSMRVGGRASPISMNDGEEWLASRVSSPGAEGDGDEMEVKEREDAREVSPAIAEIRVEESKGSAYGP